MLPEDIIIKPIITEKSNMEMQAGKYTFEVNKKATKVDVKRAVEKLFNVKVLKVNTINVSGKEKRVGRNIGKTADWKKAIVSIDVNPGAEQSYLTKGGKVTKVTKKYNDSIAEVTGV
ncbi:MAG: 50S ribosomal protein L23 [Clostridiales bacterium]|jgi:ribosomal protein L23|nr:50S ribosomal protein L23 [Clostridiales bacterium]MBB1552692.1 50S ribosomal protein L23 [Clostridiales bacterium]MBF0978814.1 50S ribosomal protein L23 [Clostridiales bacterium]